MLDKQVLKILAESERMMDEGKVPWVWAPKRQGEYDRLAVAPSIMKELGLQQGQKVNTILCDAIAEMSLTLLTEHLAKINQDVEDQQLDENFDFRNMMVEK